MKWFQPVAWSRQVVFMALLLLDFKHTFEFVAALTLHDKAPVVLIGQWLPNVTNGQFDAITYAAMVPATILFVSNTLASRLAHGDKTGTYWLAMTVGTGLSAVTNAGTMFYAATGTAIIPGWLIGIASAAIGGIVTLGLLMFSSMSSWDKRERLMRDRVKRSARAARQATSVQKGKHPAKKRKPASARTSVPVALHMEHTDTEQLG